MPQHDGSWETMENYLPLLATPRVPFKNHTASRGLDFAEVLAQEKKEKNHRIVERFGLEGALKLILFQWKGHFPLDQVLQALSNATLNTSRDGEGGAEGRNAQKRFHTQGLAGISG